MCPVPYSLPVTLVFATMVLPACSRQDIVTGADLHTLLSAMRCIVADVEVRDVVQAPDPCV